MTSEFRRCHSTMLVAMLAASALVMSGCVHRAPATIRDDATTISGHNTAHLSRSDARKTILVEAAAITVDHGYRFFEIDGPIRPGTDVRVHLYGSGDIDPRAAGVYDADQVAAGRLPLQANFLRN